MEGGSIEGSSWGTHDNMGNKIWYVVYGIEYTVYDIQCMVYKDEDPTNHDFWHRMLLMLGPWNQNVRSLCLCDPLGPYRCRKALQTRGPIFPTNLRWVGRERDALWQGCKAQRAQDSVLRIVDGGVPERPGR